MSLLEKLEEKKKQKNLQEESLTGRQVLTQAVKNIPSSGAQLISDVTMPIRHPIQTAQSLAALGRGIYQLNTPGEQPDEATAKAVGKFFADRYGSFEGFKKALATDPLGIVSDISVVLTMGAGLAARVPGLAGKTTTTISKVGNIIDPVQATAKTISATGTGLGKAATPLFGLTTGTGADAISTAYKSGASGADTQKLFLDNMRGNVDPSEIVPKALQAMKDMSGKKTSDYKTNKAALKLENTPVNFKNIKQKIVDFEKSMQFEGMSELSEKALTKLNNIKKIVAQYEKNPALHNARGMDSLKRRIDAEYPTGLAVGDSGMVVSTIRNNVKAQIIAEVPDYGKVMKNYETAMKLEKQFTSELSLGKNSNAGTTLRKLQSAMRNNVNTGYGNRLEMLKKLDPDLVTEIGGQALSNIAPRGLQGLSAGTVAAVAPFTNPSALAALPLQSPRLIGETAFKIGQLSKSLQPFKNSTTLQTARSARVIGEIEGATEVDKQAELLKLLLENPNPIDQENKKNKGFDSAEVGEIRSDALRLQDEFDISTINNNVNPSMFYAADGGSVATNVDGVASDILQKYQTIFSPQQLESEPIQKEVVFLQRLINQEQNPKFKDQTLKKIHDLQERLSANIGNTGSDSFQQSATIEMKKGLDDSVYNKIEQAFVSGDKEIIEQLQDATNLYKNYMGLIGDEDNVEAREKAANKILEQVTNKNYTPNNVVNLLFSHSKFAPNQSLPLMIAKLKNTLPEDEFVEVKDLLKDGVMTKTFSDDNNESTRSAMIKNYNDIFNNQKEIINELFTKKEITEIDKFKQNVLPTLWEEIKLRPASSDYTIISALAKKELLSYPKFLMNGSSMDIARQSLMRSKEPLIEKRVDIAVEQEQPEQITSNIGNTPTTQNLENIQTSINDFAMPQSNEPIFEMPKPELSLPQMTSPTILPDERDREIAMRQQSGIAGLV